MTQSPHPNLLPLALRLTWREFRHGLKGFRLMLLNLVLGVAVISGVFALSNTIRSSLDAESKTLLGGDVIVEYAYSQAPPGEFTLLESFGRVSHTIITRVMAQTNNIPQLIELKVVGGNYPLLGSLKVQVQETIQDWKSANYVVVDQGFLLLTNTTVGEVITIGKSSYTIAGIIKHEPDKIVNAFSFGPRVMMSMAAFERSGFNQPGAFTKHRYAIKLNKAEDFDSFFEAFEKGATSNNWQFKTKTDGNFALNRFTSNMEVLLSLAGLSILLMGGIGIYSATSSYFYQSATKIALYKTLGLNRYHINVVMAIQLMVVTTIACIIGSVLGALGSYTGASVIQNYIPIIHAQDLVFGDAFIVATMCGILTVLCFAFFPLKRYLLASPNVIFRAASAFIATKIPTKVNIQGVLIIYLSLVTLVFVFEDPGFTVGFILLATLGVCIFYTLTIVVRWLALHYTTNISWLNIALKHLARHNFSLFITLLALGGSTTLLTTLLLSEATITRHIERIIQEEAPSLFMIDIQSHQAQDVRDIVQAQPYANSLHMLPMIRGRIAKINGKDISIEDIGPESRWAVRGDRGFSYSAHQPNNAEVTKGTWWDANYTSAPLISLDERLAKGFGVDIGDRLTVEVLGKEIEATIYNLRKIDYSTFKVNFATMFSPGVLESYPHSFVATIRTPSIEEDIALTKAITTQFPNISLIQTKETLDKVNEIIATIALILKAISALTVCASLFVLASALQTSLVQQQYEHVVYKVLGASKSMLRKIHITHIIFTFLAMYGFAVAIGITGLWLMSDRLRSISFAIHWDIIAAIGLGIFTVYVAITLYFYRHIFQAKPIEWLRNE